MTTDLTHHIDRHILKILMFNQSARYRDLRPPGTESNLFNYHRRGLLNEGYITQNPDKTYSLGMKGLRLAEKASFEDVRVRDRPKITATLIITDEQGRLAVWNKPVQPFIGTVNLPNGKMRLEDASIEEAARRVIRELSPNTVPFIRLCGVAEVCVTSNDEMIAHTINMVARVQLGAKDIQSDIIYWIERGHIKNLSMTPGARQICQDFGNTEDFLYHNYLLDL